ncbi:MAG: cation:proton antiporter [archaeon]
MVAIDPILPPLVGLSFVIVVLAVLSRIVGQPSVVAYIIAGIIAGPSGLGLINDEVIVSHLGSIGVVLLLFFIGMEISVKNLIQYWRFAVFGTLLQVLLSILIVWLIGFRLGWTTNRIILLGFVITLSSTAVVIRLLQDWKELDKGIGQKVLSILLVQDIIVIPMLIILSFLGGAKVSPGHIMLQVIGGVAAVLLVSWVVRKETITLPFSRLVRTDHETQVFGAILLCLGLALLSGLFGLSTALGAFIAGIVISAAKETRWVHESLHPFRVLFVALFFVSVGMIIDISFLLDNLLLLVLLVVGALVLNTAINTGVIRLWGTSWRVSLYGGALLAQIGEFSLILAALGLNQGIILESTYQMTVLVIAISLLLSPIWIQVFKRLVCRISC